MKDKSFLRSLLAGFAALMVVVIVVPLVAFFTAYAVTKVPEPEELVNNQVSHIMAMDGKSELARIVPPEGNRQNVKLEEIPLPVRQAVLAAEDRDYYKNPGFSISGFGRAALGAVTGKSSAGGGSTITQQYVKNALVGDERSVTRKAKELVISAKMAREWSKDEILQAYLNTIYFGRNAYGISAASQAYFGKDVSKLTPGEGAVLAASIQAPSALDPWTNKERAQNRWNYVMDGMVTIGALKPADRHAAKYPKVKDPATTATTSVAKGSNGLIKSQVIQELAAAGITEQQVNTGGLRITTTIDPRAQAAAVEEAKNKLDGQPDSVRAAVVSVDPRNGGIRAWYGGDDPVGWDFANAGVQTGSTFKIFALAAYLDQGGTLNDQFDSSPVTTGNITVNNSEGTSCGTCSIAQALKLSLNTSFIRLTQSLKGGPQDVADMAHRLGVAEELPGIGKTLSENNGPPYEGVTLGQYQSRPLDMASGLATLTNAGKYYRPHFVQKVENSNGDVLLDNSKMKGDQVLREEVADNVVAAMLPIAAYSNGNVLAAGRPSASKTGTAQLGDTGENKDAWMIGSTPQLSTAVWFGDLKNKPLYNAGGGSMYGSGTPAQVWRATMDRALDGQEIQQFHTSSDTVQNIPDSGTGPGNGTAQQAPSQEPSTAPAQPSSQAPSQAPSRPAPQPTSRPRPNNPPPAAPPGGNINDLIGDLLGGRR
nr:transglycosylase domain-containing protein [Corynebacterium resistens]